MLKFKDDIHDKITKDNLQDIYFSDKRPWVVAFSGEKDSTLVFQLVLEFLESLEPEHYKPVYLLISDTQVEPPVYRKLY